MPRPKEPERLLKTKVNLFEADYEALKRLHPMQGPARVIRALVRAYVRKAERARSAISVDDLEIDEEDLEDAI